MLPLVLALSLATGQLHGEYVLSVRTEGRGRPGDVTGAPPVAADAEVTPGVVLDLSTGTAQLLAEYAPQLRLRSLSTGTVLHAGGLASEWRPDGVNRVVFLSRASYGTTDLLDPASPSPGGPSPVQEPGVLVEPVPRLTSVWVLEAGASLGAALVLGPRVRLGLSGGYVVGGALDWPAREQLPFRHGPEVRARLENDLTPIDLLSGELWVAHADFTNGANASVAELKEQLRHSFTERTQAALAAGGALLRAKPQGEATGVSGVPVAVATLSHRVPSISDPLEVTLNGGALPFVDRYAGTSYLRAEATARVSLAHKQQLRLTAAGGMAVVLTGASRGGRAAVGDLAVSYDFDRAPVSAWRLEGFILGNVNQEQLRWSLGAAVTFREHGFL